MKLHTMVNVLKDVPKLVRFNKATHHDHTNLGELSLPEGSFVVFDKAYTDYRQYHQLSQDNVYFITCQKDHAAWERLQEYSIDDSINAGVIKDEQIKVTKDGQDFLLSSIAYYHAEQYRIYILLTNNHELAADKITEIYKNRWQIESMFKRLKQNFPFKYFLGDSQYAIEIQIWVSLIAQLLMLVVQRKTQRRGPFPIWLIRCHLNS